MRQIKYLSPTSISLFEKSVSDYYRRYLSENRQPREPQTKPMSIGSAFDAYVKSYLHEKIIGKDPEFEFEALFETQVEEQNRDWARHNGKHCFDLYRESGALSDLLIELNQAISTPVFEKQIQGVVKDRPTSPGVVLHGRPDIYYIGQDGTPIIIDWKVNGWCSNSPVSPKRGHVGVRFGSPARHLDKPHHRNAHLMKRAGIFVNVAISLDDVAKDWARQLSVYAWLCGAKVGSDFIVGIDQVCCKPVGKMYPEVRFARHRCGVSKEFQRETYATGEKLWEIVNSDWIFRDMSREASIARCEALDGIDETDDLFNEMTAKPNTYY